MDLEERTGMPQNTIALIYDSDKTLTHTYMQEAMLDHYGVTIEDFQYGYRAIQERERMRGKKTQGDVVYLHWFLEQARKRNSPLKGLTTNELQEWGRDLAFFPGIPDFFAHITHDIEEDHTYKKHNIKLEHYVLSNGFADMLRASALSKHIPTDHLYGCEFTENENGVITGIAQSMSFTEKTRALFEINKGTDTADIDVNAVVPQRFRPIPFAHMVYFGDGPTDIPCFSVIKQYGGFTFVVYDPTAENPMRNAFPLHESGRVHFCTPADYRPESHLYATLTCVIGKIADSIVRSREQTLQKHIVQPPRH